jgi:hypothetical protein
MKLANNTNNEVFYGIESPGEGDCGTIDAGGTADLPQYDNQENVTVTFQAMPDNQVSPFTVTIPDSGEGMAVTIGIQQE